MTVYILLFVYTQVLTTGYWPTFPAINVAVPPAIQAHMVRPLPPSISVGRSTISLYFSCPIPLSHFTTSSMRVSCCTRQPYATRRTPPPCNHKCDLSSSVTSTDLLLVCMATVCWVQELFSTYYGNKFQGRRLQWQHALERLVGMASTRMQDKWLCCS